MEVLGDRPPGMAAHEIRKDNRCCATVRPGKKRYGGGLSRLNSDRPGMDRNPRRRGW